MSTDVPEAIPAPARRRSWAAAIVAILGLACVSIGAAVLLRAGPGSVTMIRVTKHSMLPEAIVGSPDYYLNVVLGNKQTLATEAYDDAPIGNGLDFKLPKPIELEAIASVELMDEDVGSDDIRDRVDVRERMCKGQDYAFELIGPTAPSRTAGYWALGGGAGLLVGAAILLARAYAI